MITCSRSNHLAFENKNLAFKHKINRSDLYVRARALTGFLPLLKQYGGDPQVILTRHGLTPEQIEDEDFSLPLRLFAELMSDAAVMLQQDDFGIRLSARQNLSVLGPIALVAQHAGSVAEVLERVGRYMPYHSPGLTLTMQVEGQHAVLQLTHDLDVRGEVRRHLTELSFGVAVAFIRLITNCAGSDWRIEYQHDSPLCPADYRRLIGCQVQLQQAADRLLFPVELLQVPIDSANSALQEAAERSVRHLIQRYPLDLGRQVSGLVERSLTSGNCTLPVIAVQMQTPPHMLQRRLAALGLRFEDIVDNLRRERARDLLPHPHIPLTEVAFLLGYGDPSSLTRACRRWFGKTPKALRQAALPLKDFTN